MDASSVFERPLLLEATVCQMLNRVRRGFQKNAKKSTKFVDSDVEDNHPVPAASKRAPSETKTAPSPLAKTRG